MEVEVVEDALPVLLLVGRHLLQVPVDERHVAVRPVVGGRYRPPSVSADQKYAVQPHTTGPSVFAVGSAALTAAAYG